MSGNPSASAAILGEGLTELRRMGSDAAFIIAAMYGQSLYACGRYDEANDAASIVLDQGSWGVSERVLALGVRGMVAARRGAFEEGERLALEALTIIDRSDFICDRADARMALAEVMELASDRGAGDDRGAGSDRPVRTEGQRHAGGSRPCPPGLAHPLTRRLAASGSPPL